MTQLACSWGGVLAEQALPKAEEGKGKHWRKPQIKAILTANFKLTFLLNDNQPFSQDRVKLGQFQHYFKLAEKLQKKCYLLHSFSWAGSSETQVILGLGHGQDLNLLATQQNRSFWLTFSLRFCFVALTTWRAARRLVGEITNINIQVNLLTQSFAGD